MASSTDRFALYEMMRDAWGEPLATAFIEMMPPMASSDIATKQDVENLGVHLRGEMAELRGELRGEMAALRGEFRASSRHTIVTIIAAAVSIWLSFYLPTVL
jgi:chorismate synthase